MRRRDFLLSAASLGALDFLAAIDKPFAKGLEKHLSRIHSLHPDHAATDEEFWNYIRTCYNTSTNLINLNNGGVSPQPRVVQEAHIKNYSMSNEAPSYFMWRILDLGRENLRNKLAVLAGVSADEIAINRNSTEGLNTIIFGLDLKPGDEIVLSRFDYPNMMNAWKQREKRDKVKLVWIDIPQPLENEDEIIEKYRQAITSRTRIVHITHMINWTGNLVPCKRIADMAHSKGCEVIVDAAHTFAHLNFKIPDTGADYFATSLHKWLGAPFGSGLLYIRKEKVKKIWALLSAVEPDGEDIRKFESLGTRSFASEMAIGTAIDFHNMIGAERKEKRLRYLKDYWATKAKDLKGAKLYTSLKPDFSCALGNIGFEGWQAHQIESKLFEKYKIHTVSIIHEKVNGIRITPHVYTTLTELDFLLKGLAEISDSTPSPAKTR